MTMKYSPHEYPTWTITFCSLRQGRRKGRNLILFLAVGGGEEFFPSTWGEEGEEGDEEAPKNKKYNYFSTEKLNLTVKFRPWFSLDLTEGREGGETWFFSLTWGEEFISSAWGEEGGGRKKLWNQLLFGFSLDSFNFVKWARRRNFYLYLMLVYFSRLTIMIVIFLMARINFYDPQHACHIQ